MIKKIAAIIFLLTPLINAHAQKRTIDSLRKLIATAKDDTTRVVQMRELGKAYVYSKPDSTLLLARQSLELATTIQFLRGEEISLNALANVYTLTGNYPKALSTSLASLKIGESIRDLPEVERNLHDIGNIYSYMGDEKQSLTYSYRAKSIAQAAHMERALTIDLINVGDSYEKLNMLDSALFYTKQGYLRTYKGHDNLTFSNVVNNLGNIYSKMHRLDSALHYYRRALLPEKLSVNYDAICETTLGMAKIFREKGQADSSLYYARLSIVGGWRGGFTVRVLDASTFLTQYFEKKGQLDSAFHYQKVLISAKDSLFSQEKTSTFQNLSFAERQRQQDIKEQQAAYRASIRYYLLTAIIIFLIIMAFVFWRNNKQNKKARMQIQHTLDELKTTQTQLIQSEKMASLGELTAGIAHEIQNPLNFVNNFSEVSAELVDEMDDELDKGDVSEAKAIGADLKQNLEKIRHHGKRADAIVKGMLQHSQTGSGAKELVNINALADEYMRLAYHGLRAKDKSFNADLITNYDEHLPQINAIPQDIGRVLLNLFNNAFYAVNQKAKIAGSDYKPTVEVSTQLAPPSGGGGLIIKVKDNGTGIPDAIKEKIMQPFFTTKPTGEGTGLGLSLTYDMVVKGHGGSIQINSVEGEGSEFIIQLPIN